MINLEAVKNGYILNIGGSREIYKEEEIEKLFTRLLQHLTGKAPSFGGDQFGEVKVNFDRALRK